MKRAGPRRKFSNRLWIYRNWSVAATGLISRSRTLFRATLHATHPTTVGLTATLAVLALLLVAAVGVTTVLLITGLDTNTHLECCDASGETNDHDRRGQSFEEHDTLLVGVGIELYYNNNLYFVNISYTAQNGHIWQVLRDKIMRIWLVLMTAQRMRT